MSAWETIGIVAGAILSLIGIIGGLVAFTRWFMKQVVKWLNSLLKPMMEKLDELHESGKCRAKENGIIFRALLGIIDCLETQKINGNLSKAKKEINEYLTKLEDE